MTDMDKRTEHMSFRLEPELKHRAEAVAIAEDMSPSCLVHDAVEAYVNAKVAHAMKISRAVLGDQGVSGRPPL